MPALQARHSSRSSTRFCRHPRGGVTAIHPVWTLAFTKLLSESSGVTLPDRHGLLQHPSQVPDRRRPARYMNRQRLRTAALITEVLDWIAFGQRPSDLLQVGKQDL